MPIILLALCAVGQCSLSDSGKGQPPSASTTTSVEGTNIEPAELRVAPPEEDIGSVDGEFVELYKAAERDFSRLFELHAKRSTSKEKVYQQLQGILRIVLRTKLEDLLTGSNERNKKMLFILEKSDLAVRKFNAALGHRVIGVFNLFQLLSLYQFVEYSSDPMGSLISAIH